MLKKVMAILLVGALSACGGGGSSSGSDEASSISAVWGMVAVMESSMRFRLIAQGFHPAYGRRFTEITRIVESET